MARIPYLYFLLGGYTYLIVPHFIIFLEFIVVMIIVLMTDDHFKSLIHFSLIRSGVIELLGFVWAYFCCCCWDLHLHLDCWGLHLHLNLHFLWNLISTRFFSLWSTIFTWRILQHGSYGNLLIFFRYLFFSLSNKIWIFYDICLWWCWLWIKCQAIRRSNFSARCLLTIFRILGLLGLIFRMRSWKLYNFYDLFSLILKYFSSLAWSLCVLLIFFPLRDNTLDSRWSTSIFPDSSFVSQEYPLTNYSKIQQ